MDNRKFVKKSGDEKEDSAMSTDSFCESFYSSNETTALNNSQELSSQVVGSTSSLMELLLLDSNEPSSTRNNTQAETAISKPREHFVSCGSSSSCNKTSSIKNPPQFPRQLGPFNPLSMKKTEACQSNELLKARNVFVHPMAPKKKRKEHEKIPLRAMVQVTSKLHKARNLPEVKSDINSGPLNGEASASTHQPLVPDSTSTNDYVNLPYSSYDELNSVKSRNIRKVAKKTGNKAEDSAMSTVFLNAPFSSLRNSQVSRTQAVESKSLLRNSNESSSRDNASAELQENHLDEVLSQLYTSFISCGPSSRGETSPTRNPPEFPKQRVPSSPSSLEKTEACQPNGRLKPRETYIIHMVPKRKTKDHQKKPLQAMEHAISISDEARKLPNEIGVDASEAMASRSTHQQPLVQNGISTDGQPSSHHACHSGISRENVCGQIESCSNKFPIHVSEARILLRSVLKEIMLYNKKKDQWWVFALQLINDCESSEKYGNGMGKGLKNYLFDFNTSTLWKHGQDMSRLMTMESYVEGSCEMLTAGVVSALIHITTVQLSRNFDGFILTYLSLRGSYDSFSHFWESNSIEAIEDETSRNRLKSRKKMIQKLLLLTLTACRMFLVYVGENAEEEKLRKYEEHLSDEDKTYLGRNG